MTKQLSDSLYLALVEVYDGHGRRVSDRSLKALQRRGLVIFTGHVKLPALINRSTIKITSDGVKCVHAEA